MAILAVASGYTLTVWVPPKQYQALCYSTNRQTLHSRTETPDPGRAVQTMVRPMVMCCVHIHFLLTFASCLLKAIFTPGRCLAQHTAQALVFTGPLD